MSLGEELLTGLWRLFSRCTQKLHSGLWRATLLLVHTEAAFGRDEGFPVAVCMEPCPSFPRPVPKLHLLSPG